MVSWLRKDKCGILLIVVLYFCCSWYFGFGTVIAVPWLEYHDYSTLVVVSSLWDLRCGTMMVAARYHSCGSMGVLVLPAGSCGTIVNVSTARVIAQLWQYQH